MIKSVAVYCSSSSAIDQAYFADAEEVGRLLAENGWRLVWGGVDMGLMAAVASSTQNHGGQVTGIIPKTLADKKLAYEKADTLIVAPDLSERKQMMFENADAFVILAGGFGTAEEALEILSWK